MEQAKTIRRALEAGMGIIGHVVGHEINLLHVFYERIISYYVCLQYKLPVDCDLKMNPHKL